MAFEGIVNFFSTMCETQDSNKNPNKKMLITHYYANSYEKAKAAISSICQNDLALEMISIDDHYHELFYENKKFYIIVTIGVLSAYEISVDAKVKVSSFTGLGKPAKILDQFFSLLNKRLTLKRIGGSQDE